jgi:hypothetical protein
MKTGKIFLLGLLLSTAVQAQVSVGSYTAFVGQYHEDTAGGTNQLDINPFIGLFYPLRFAGVILKPELGLILFDVESDDEYSKTGYYWLIDVAMPLNQMFDLRFGISTFTTRYSGDGGLKTQNNGTSTTEFNRPSESESTSIFALNLGVDFYFPSLQNYSLRFETFLNRPFDDSRAFSYMLSGNALLF